MVHGSGEAKGRDERSPGIDVSESSKSPGFCLEVSFKDCHVKLASEVRWWTWKLEIEPGMLSNYARLCQQTLQDLCISSWITQLTSYLPCKFTDCGNVRKAEELLSANEATQILEAQGGFCRMCATSEVCYTAGHLSTCGGGYEKNWLNHIYPVGLIIVHSWLHQLKMKRYNPAAAAA